MATVELERFKLEGLLGSGSDYEAYAATDDHTGKPVVVKRPNPDYIARKLHHGVDQVSEQLIEVHNAIGDSLACVAHLVGYTDVARHGDYFGDSLNESYRVLVADRARGLPLVSDIRDKFKGVPIGLGQNLFALHPLVPHPQGGRFAVHRQLMEVEEAFYKAGHLLLDMRPQNVYFDPGEGRITVIDIGTIPTQGPAAQGRASMGDQPKDVHDFFAEVFKFYAAPDSPPSNVAGYGEPSGMRSIPNFQQQLDVMIRSFSGVQDPGLKEAAIATLQKIRDRSYSSFEDFTRDFDSYLGLLEERNKTRPDIDSLTRTWGQALKKLSEDYWTKFLFNPDSDLDTYRNNINRDTAS
jgi:hypothetical protein